MATPGCKWIAEDKLWGVSTQCVLVRILRVVGEGDGGMKRSTEVTTEKGIEGDYKFNGTNKVRRERNDGNLQLAGMTEEHATTKG